MGDLDYRRVFAATDDPLLVCDADSGRVVDANERVCTLLAAERSTLTDTALDEWFVPARDQTRPLDVFRTRDPGTDSVRVEGTVEYGDRDGFIAAIRVSQLSDEHVLVSIRPSEGPGSETDEDIPSDVLAQLVEHTPDVMWMFSADWEEYVFVNSAYEDVFGRSLSKLRSHPPDFLNGVHPEDRDDVRAAMQRLSAGAEIDIEYRTDPTTDFGRHVWVHGIPIRDDDGEVYRVAGFVREVTERREHEMELLRQRNLVRNVPIGVFRVMLDDDREIVQANPALVSMLDATDADDLIGRPVTDFFHDPDAVPTIVERLDDEGTVTLEMRFETRTGDVFWGRVTAVRQTDDAGRPIADGVIEDITTRKHRQQQLRVVDRILRHNIRNDVSVISGYATYLDENDVVSNPEPVRAIRDRSRELLRTAEKGHVVVDVLSEGQDPVTYDVVPSIERTVEGLRDTHDDVVIETSLPESAAVRALREIEVVVRELVENSIVHHDGAPTVGIEVADATDGIQIRISDDGPGIPQREYEILSGTEDADHLSHGSGMGLWLVHWIVRLSGGEIDFETSEDGSTVVVTLPTGEASTDLPTDSAGSG